MKSKKGQRGKKICPDCGKAQGVRTFKCECGYVFVAKDKAKPKPAKGIGKGRKACPECKMLVGPRTHYCVCGHQFEASKGAKRKPTKIKKVKFKKIVEDWKTLEKGDKIRTLKGYGPHYVDESGEKKFFRERGVLIVQHKDRNGLICHGPQGSGYIYMGPVSKSTVVPNGIKEPHKIVRVR